MFYSVDFVRVEIIMKSTELFFMFSFSWSALCTNVVIAVLQLQVDYDFPANPKYFDYSS